MNTRGKKISTRHIMIWKRKTGEKIRKIWEDNRNLPIHDGKLKKRIAKLCLKLIDETPNDKAAMMETCHIITGNFMWRHYDDELEDAIDLAGELELPEEHVSGDVMEKWAEMKEKFKAYIDKDKIY
jgi:hypothetical protein